MCRYACRWAFLGYFCAFVGIRSYNSFIHDCLGNRPVPERASKKTRTLGSFSLSHRSFLLSDYGVSNGIHVNYWVLTGNVFLGQLNTIILPSQLLVASVSTIGSRMMLSIHKVQLSNTEDSDVLPTNFVPSDIDIQERSTLT
ncbi:hypothetical protein Clacol_004459 [Clathrus columnatus]|uniref:Uncharacterized protein n=1 Tax=Clathrus columnatus TaxID=1419009 RepID=A0AAV5A9T2_9AGAM|nr:hypothetical protein Clacol_004459 [Clathrus columnatus]